MTQQEISAECSVLFKSLEEGEKRLSELRELCSHENTFEGTFSYRVGCYQPAIICSDCRQLVKYISAQDYLTVINEL